MRASRQEGIGAAGVSDVTAAFERLDWGTVENARHDLGTDIFVLARDERRFDLGLVVGLQVKTGASYFREPVKGSTSGWWFRDPDGAHVAAWLSHAVPHLIVLHDAAKRISYWQHVTTETVVSTGKGRKVLVPAANTIDPEHRDALLAVAASHRPTLTLEGTAWTGSRSLAPVDLLRHALIAPRLVAPHPNAGPPAIVTAEQAVAMLAQARLHELDHLANTRADVPSRSEAAVSSAWAWRFFGAFAHRVTTGDFDALLRTIDDAPDPPARAAATVAVVGALLERGRTDQAVALLETALAHDDATPVDHAWLTVQHARSCAEIGRLQEARTEAVAVQAIRSSAPDDVTA